MTAGLAYYALRISHKFRMTTTALEARRLAHKKVREAHDRVQD